MDQRLVDKIREVQKNEGNQPCFRSGIWQCQNDCCWRELCECGKVYVFAVKE